MSCKVVYQTDQNGVYVEDCFAQESPLEPGVFLIPAGAVEIAPPTVAENEYAKWNGKEWETHVLETPSDEQLWEDIRNYRNSLLSSCDWTQLPDSPLTLEAKEKWSKYRQELRDIPQKFHTIDDIIWPFAP